MGATGTPAPSDEVVALPGAAAATGDGGGWNPGPDATRGGGGPEDGAADGCTIWGRTGSDGGGTGSDVNGGTLGECVSSFREIQLPILGPSAAQVAKPDTPRSKASHRKEDQ